ncbi:MAG: T9SS type A sorting domain-containing protein [Saprospiraceae bacterium]|nr:T9SS type A sorting domain-containing protein [Saprospiraceae bacterium]
MKSSLIALLASLSISLTAQIQMSHQTIASTGHSHESSNLQMSATVGQSSIATVRSEDFILTQGFQQGDLLLSTSSENWLPIHGLHVYPNPFVDHLTLEFDDLSASLSYEIFRIDGPRVVRGMVDDKIISLESLPNGTYILALTDKSRRQNLMIQKIQ